MLAAQCDSGELIASLIGTTFDTLARACEREKKMRFAEYAKIKRGSGRERVRKKQLDMALKGNVALLIWLGKQYLGQSDKIQETHKFEPVVIRSGQAETTLTLRPGEIKELGEEEQEREKIQENIIDIEDI